MQQTEVENNVHRIFPLNDVKAFTEEEAYELVNLFYSVTSRAKKSINALNSQIEYHKAMPAQLQVLQSNLNTEIQKWSEKTRRLGGVPLSLFKVKIPATEGYFIWEYPSVDLEHHY